MTLTADVIAEVRAKLNTRDRRVSRPSKNRSDKGRFLDRSTNEDTNKNATPFEGRGAAAPVALQFVRSRKGLETPAPDHSAAQSVREGIVADTVSDGNASSTPGAAP